MTATQDSGVPPEGWRISDDRQRAIKRVPGGTSEIGVHPGQTIEQAIEAAERAEAKLRLCGPSPDDQCRAWEAEYPGWSVTVDSDGHVRASSGGVTLNPPGLGMVGHVIADYLHQQECAARQPAAVTT